jgi:hypothetical protein
VRKWFTRQPEFEKILEGILFAISLDYFIHQMETDEERVAVFRKELNQALALLDEFDAPHYQA